MLQPINIKDTAPFFQKLHSDMKELHIGVCQPITKKWTNISHYLRLSYTESIMESKSFAFMLLTQARVNIITVDLVEQTCFVKFLENPPKYISEVAPMPQSMLDTQELFSFTLAMEMQDLIDEGYLFGDTQKLLSEALI